MNDEYEKRVIYLTNFKNKKFRFTRFTYFSDFCLIVVFLQHVWKFAQWLSQNKLIWIQECSIDTSANRQRKKYRICHLLQPPSQTGVILHFQMFSCLLFFSSKENKMLLKYWSLPKKAAIITCRPCGLLARPMWFTTGWLSLIFLSIFHQGWGGEVVRKGGKEQRAWTNERDGEGENESKRRRWEV